MGPAAWAAVGRALGLAAASVLFKSDASVFKLVAKQIEHALAQRDLEFATMLLRDLAYRHRAAFETFMEKFGADLPAEAREELGRV